MKEKFGTLKEYETVTRKNAEPGLEIITNKKLFTRIYYVITNLFTYILKGKIRL